MTPKSFRLFTVLLLVLAALLISPACLTLTGGTSAGTEAPEGAESVEVDVDFGPGPFNFTNTRAGLTELSSYKATLSMSFDGTRDGQTQTWSKTYVMLSSKEPATLQLNIEKTGDLASLDPIFMAEADGVDYQRSGENGCFANAIVDGDSLGERLEPAGFLSAVIGADEAGSEPVNDMAANHYTFDQRALGQQDLSESTGEMWIATEGGYILKYLLTTKGDAEYFGEGIEGTLTLDYQLSDINQPVTFVLPSDCPAGMVTAPQLPDASDVVNMPGVLSFNTSTGLTEAVAFYQEQIPTLGWALKGDPVIDETSAFLEYEQGDQILSVIVITEEDLTTVNILLSNSQE